MQAPIQFVALYSGWDVRDASASVAASTGLPKATDGSAGSVPNSAARGASDGRGICVMNVSRKARTQIRRRLRRDLRALTLKRWTEDS